MNICDKYGTCVNGLPSREAERRQELYGLNELPKKPPVPLVVRFFSALKDPMLIVLLGASVVSLVLAFVDFEITDLFEPLLIFFIVGANALISAVQERKAEKSLASLADMSARSCKVRRDGEEKIIDVKLLVPGDVIVLHAGDVVPADGEIIDAHLVSCEESMLTGESEPVYKSIGDVVYSGCSVTTGKCTAVVEKTGESTEMGRIASMLEGTANRPTPLQEKLKKLSEQLGIISLVICLAVFVIGLFGIYVTKTSPMNNMTLFMTAIALAVSALPEGLPTTVTIVLSAGTRLLSAKGAIVKNLPAVETLGSVSVICTDKTGTLTTGKMQVTEVVGFSDVDVLALASACTDNLSDPTDSAVLNAYHGAQAEKLSVTPFDNVTRIMSVTAKFGDKVFRIYKGAFESISSLTGDYHASVQADSMSQKGLRVIAVASKEIDGVTGKESPLTVVGLLGLSDPPREEVKNAIKECKSAGIRPVMLTGDGAGSAKAVADALGISGDVVTGAELDRLTDKALFSRLDRIGVFARVTPSNKLRIVKAFQTVGKVVGVTGDGVNDAPALASADIGCAMGSGTEVAKSEADIVLTDDNFTTIVGAVRTGRGIFDNIRKAVAFLLGTNIGETVAVFAAICISFDSPLLSMQLLWINLISDSLPAIALGCEKVEKDVMERAPLPRGEGIFTKGVLIRLTAHGLLFGAIALVAFYGTLYACGDLAVARTASFLALSLSQTLHAYNMRTLKPLFTVGVFSNKLLNIATALSVALIALVTLVPPIATAFGMSLMPLWCYALCFGLAVLPIVIDESVKLVLYFTKKSKSIKKSVLA